MRSPSVKTLSLIFGDNAKRAKQLLAMTRDELLATPVGLRRLNECWHPPTTADVRMECLNALGDFYGVEVLETKRGPCFYLNAGDTYTPTLVRWEGVYRVASWGDIAERFAIGEAA